MAVDSATATGSGPAPPPSTGGAMGHTTLEDRLEAILSSPHQFSVANFLNTALQADPQQQYDKESGAGDDENAMATMMTSLAVSTPDDPSGGEDLGQRMAELALQLQLKTQACHEDIGKIGAELQAILPRCCADVGRVGVGLEGLRLDAATLLEATLVESEPDVSSSLETLSTLHALQANLTRTREILTAAATWDATLSSVAPLLAQQHLLQAVDALAQLEKGERALRGMPNPEQRTAAIAKIRQQVTTLLQPQLAHALSNMHSRLAPLQQCVSLYAKLDQMETLQAEYVKNRPAPIHKAWFDYTPSYTTSQADAAVLEKGQSFLSWLPTWFDAVLDLITEERRQSQTIFGAALVPEMLARVLAECFRPILPSFKSRLESIYSSNPLGPSQGSLESICGVYESTLQFLSLAYETIANGWLDLVESGMLHPGAPIGNSDSKKGISGLDLYQDMVGIFLQVASPFTPYQERLPQLEAKHAATIQENVTTEIQRAVAICLNVSSSGGSGSFDLDCLQAATEKLNELATSVFRTAQGGLARFEVLLGGYGPTTALATIDKVLAQHASALGVAVHGLSGAGAADGGSGGWADQFEESLVLCALNVLVVAGSFRREMRQLEVKSRERMSVLSERMAKHLAMEQKVQEAMEAVVMASSSETASNKSAFGYHPKRGSSSASFALPDGLSAVEIDSIITKCVCEKFMSEEDFDASASILQRLAAASSSSVSSTSLVTVTGSTPTTTILYPEAEESMQRLAHSCHMFVFDVCSAVPRRHLSGVPSMQAWKEEATADDFASYGVLPQQYVTHVGEHMLALVQALEPFASDKEALSLANEAMANVRNVALSPWKELVEASAISNVTDQIVRSIMDGKAIVDRVSNSATMEDEEDLDEEENEENKAVTVFCNSWLDVVGLAVTGRLLERFLRIPSLTPKGCEHMNADLNYLVNVFSALGVAGHPHPLLGHMAELAILDRDSVTETISSRNRSDPVDLALVSIEERLAAIRGVSAQFNY